ncbi:hypothetical protein SUGI_1013040 [Cryptomeria japonica]|nr:hypothetical protein SUGI_1013040 [Cryptomeria japonica]
MSTLTHGRGNLGQERAGMMHGRRRSNRVLAARCQIVVDKPREIYERNLVYLHSTILEWSEFFQIKMSERFDKTTDVRVVTSHDFEDFLKCIQLMYGERVYFSTVEECLAILLVASEMLVDDCIHKCQQYLEAVRWSVGQETQMRGLMRRTTTI